MTYLFDGFANSARLEFFSYGNTIMSSPSMVINNLPTSPRIILVVLPFTPPTQNQKHKGILIQ